MELRLQQSQGLPNREILINQEFFDHYSLEDGTSPLSIKKQLRQRKDGVNFPIRLVYLDSQLHDILAMSHWLDDDLKQLFLIDAHFQSPHG